MPAYEEPPVLPGGSFLFVMTDLNNLNAARMGAAGKGWTEQSHPREKCMQIWLADQQCLPCIRQAVTYPGNSVAFPHEKDPDRLLSCKVLAYRV